jgi:hypothetical protein
MNQSSTMKLTVSVSALPLLTAGLAADEKGLITGAGRACGEP